MITASVDHAKINARYGAAFRAKMTVAGDLSLSYTRKDGGVFRGSFSSWMCDGRKVLVCSDRVGGDGNVSGKSVRCWLVRGAERRAEGIRTGVPRMPS